MPGPFWFLIVLSLLAPGVASAMNTPPVADAGRSNSVELGQPVVLDASGSTDADGDPLTYLWTLTPPEGSSASLSDDTALMPTFVPDVPGVYVIGLIVNDGHADSELCEIFLVNRSVNTPPVADAGRDDTARRGETVQLDGSGSSDVDGDTLMFDWVLTSVPPGSTATLSDPGAVRPTLVVDVLGDYVARLVVNDGMADSAPDEVVITTANSPPVADAGTDQSVALGDGVQLDGRGSSDADGDPLSFRWSLLNVPAGSTAALTGADTPEPTFTADLPGSYVAQLIVNDGFEDSAPDTVAVSTLNSRPVADAGPDQAARGGERVELDGGNSFDPDGDTLTYAWSLLVQPPLSAADIEGADAEVAALVPDLAGEYVVQLIVSDGRLDSEPDTTLITTTVLSALSIDDVRVVEGDAGTPVARFTVTLNVPSADPVSVQYDTADITATAGEDYVGVIGGVVNFPAGEVTQTIDIQLLDDDLVEGEETFAVLLSNPVNAVLDDAEGIATIVNDDLPELVIDSVEQDEGNGPNFMEFTVTLIGNAAGPVTVDFQTEDGSARVQAEDYLAASGTLQFQGFDGETLTISVQIFGDSTVEPDEEFFVRLSNAVNARIRIGEGVGTLINDDRMSLALPAPSGDPGIARNVAAPRSGGSASGWPALFALALVLAWRRGRAARTGD